MSDELKPFAWCYQTIAGVIVFQKWPASDKEWAQRNNDVAGATKYPNAHSVTDLYTAADLAALRTQLAAMTAERDELQTSMDELRKACAEVIGADPQTWPDHGNAPLAIAASLGLRSIELDRATAERDNWKETSVTIAGELADTKDERDAAMAKVVVLRDALRMLRDDIAEYATINHLGGFDNHAMKSARNALEKTR